MTTTPKSTKGEEPGPAAARDVTGPAVHVATNEVTLVGRVSAIPESRVLPSGDALTTVRVIVDRPPQRGSSRRAVDVIEVGCWTRRTQRTAGSLGPGDEVRVEGALRRRFFATSGGRASRYEVEATRVQRLSRAG